MRIISWTDTEGPPVSSLNCDKCHLRSYDITAGYKCAYVIVIIIIIRENEDKMCRVWL